MGKKRYEELELEVVRFDAEDVVATSGGGEPSSPCIVCPLVDCSLIAL